MIMVALVKLVFIPVRIVCQQEPHAQAVVQQLTELAPITVLVRILTMIMVALVKVVFTHVRIV